KRHVSSRPPVAYQLIDTAGSLPKERQKRVYFLPNRYQKTKEQKEGLQQLNETRRDMKAGTANKPKKSLPNYSTTMRKITKQINVEEIKQLNRSMRITFALNAHLCQQAENMLKSQ
ncbi:5938_t:CDS:2, partial [Entrophospora sp. SA101]